MKKIISILSVLAFALSAFPVSAAQPDFAPESNGTYDVPGHPNLKVRVFVHNPKPGKPGPTPVPEPIVCGDPNINDVVGTTGWYLPETFTYNLNLSSVPGSVSGLAAIVQDAFGSWTSAIPGRVAVTQGENTGITRATYDGKNIIAWGRANGSALAVTYTWYNRYTYEAVEVDTIMNKKFFWTSAACYANSYDAQNILTHELGHWFGLNDHYTNNYIDNTMYGYGSKGETKKDTLTDGDIFGLQAIYP